MRNNNDGVNYELDSGGHQYTAIH